MVSKFTAYANKFSGEKIKKEFLGLHYAPLQNINKCVRYCAQERTVSTSQQWYCLLSQILRPLTVRQAPARVFLLHKYNPFLTVCTGCIRHPQLFILFLFKLYLLTWKGAEPFEFAMCMCVGPDICMHASVCTHVCVYVCLHMSAFWNSPAMNGTCHLGATEVSKTKVFLREHCHVRHTLWR